MIKLNNRESSGFVFVEILLVLATLAVIGAAGYFVAKHVDKRSTVTNTPASTVSNPSATKKPFKLPSSWTWYTNTQVGFQLAYPLSWGTPTYSASPGQTGTAYELSFYPDTGTSPLDQYGNPEYKSRDPVIIQMDTENYTFTSTNDAGRTSTGGPVATSASIEKILDNLSSQTNNCTPGTCQPIVTHNATSYTEILTNTGDSPTDLLDLYGIVNLPKVNVSAIYIDYELLDSENDCTLNNLSPNSKEFCINQSVQDILSQVASSVEATP